MIVLLMERLPYYAGSISTGNDNIFLNDYTLLPTPYNAKPTLVLWDIVISVTLAESSVT